MPLTAAEQTLANMGTVMGEGERKRNAEMSCAEKEALEPGRDSVTQFPRVFHISAGGSGCGRFGERSLVVLPGIWGEHPISNRAKAGKKGAHNRFWLGRRRVTRQIGRAH